jgi:glycosyltransferase involved in cell wall biosynthesis
MRIAQIAPLHEAVPPKLYGGTERVVSYLTEELVALGHQVTLFASGDSVTSACLYPAWPRSLRLDPAVRDVIAPHMLMLEEVRRRAEDFDVLHFHLDYWPFSTFSRQNVPFVTTLHGRLDLPELQPVFTAFRGVPVVSISNAQRLALPQARFVATVPHGVPDGRLAAQPQITPTYLAFLGRIAPEKGPASAIPRALAASRSESPRRWTRPTNTTSMR